jgi:hypothetical protein
MNLFPKAAAILVTFAGAVGFHWTIHTLVGVQASPPLEAFFERVLQNPSALPKFEELLEMSDGIATMRPDAISHSLPTILTALSHQDKEVKAYACSALFAIAGRSDGAKLLRSHINAIGQDLLTNPFQNIQAGEIGILGRIRPPLPEGVVLLLSFLKQTDRFPNAQGGAIFELLHMAPEKPEVVTAIQEFLSRPLDSTTRIGILNALGNPVVKDPQIIAFVLAALDDPDPGVRSTAIQAAMRIGKPALQAGETILTRLAADSTQSAEIQNYAKQALAQLHRPN